MNTPTKITDKEKRGTEISLLPIYQYQNIEDITKRILTLILKRCDGNKSSYHPSAHAMEPAEVVALKVYYIELKYYCQYFLLYSQS